MIPVLIPNGLHQGGMVQLKNGDWWFIIMQDRAYRACTSFGTGEMGRWMADAWQWW